MIPGMESNAAPDLGRFAPFALLTGAGFSCNWGGLPASKIWEKIVSAPGIADHLGIQAVLATAGGDYETALHLARTDRDLAPRDYAVLENAVIDVFRSQEGRMWTIAGRAKLNEHMVREFLSLFGPGPRSPNIHDRYETGYIFTLNQDWLMERLWSLGDVGYPKRPFTPGVPVHTDVYRAQQRDQFDLRGTRQVPDSAPARWPLRLRENINYLKLHGSFEWRAADGSNVLVMGGKKNEQIARFPILKAFFEVFRRVCESAGVRLMVIGYGFRDSHVNAVLADACRKRPGERWIFIIDLETVTAISERLRKEAGDDGAIIAAAIYGGSTELLSGIFAPPDGHHRTEEYRRILLHFFGQELPG
jgi:hypothetical protein